MSEGTTIETGDFRRALGAFATGITVITTLGPRGEPVGLTANSFNSVSLDPPLVLFSVGRHARSLTAFLSSHHFAVNILSDDQKALSDGFARPTKDKWAGIDFETWEHGCPILPGCLANLECQIRYTHMGGDHVIFVGKVERMAYDPEGAPLVYFRGGYCGIEKPD